MSPLVRGASTGAGGSFNCGFHEYDDLFRWNQVLKVGGRLRRVTVVLQNSQSPLGERFLRSKDFPVRHRTYEIEHLAE
jgi:hypothetical protein